MADTIDLEGDTLAPAISGNLFGQQGIAEVWNLKIACPQTASKRNSGSSASTPLGGARMARALVKLPG